MSNKEKEIWKSIEDGNGYTISNRGRLKYDNKIVKPYETDKGYHRYILRNLPFKKFRAAHRLVAIAHVPNPDNLPQVNHIDGNKQNNNDWNLEWTTSKDNVKHSFDTGLRKDNISITLTDISTDTVTEYRSLNELSKFLDIGIDTLVSYIYRSKQYPIYEKYIIDIEDESLDRMLNTTKTQAIPIYCKDTITYKVTKYRSVAHAAIHTGISSYSVREALGKKGMDTYYTGGYLLSYKDLSNDETTFDELLSQQDRDKMLSKPIIKIGNEIVLHNYDTGEDTVYPGRDEVSMFLGVKVGQVTDAIGRIRRKDRTWLLGGYGIKFKHDTHPWHEYSKLAIENSKRGIKFDTPLFKVIYPDGKEEYVTGILKMSNIIGATINQLKPANNAGQGAINKLLERLNSNVTVIKI